MQFYTIHAERHTASSSRPNLRKRVMLGGETDRQLRDLSSQQLEVVFTRMHSVAYQSHRTTSHSFVRTAKTRGYCDLGCLLQREELVR